MPRSMAPLPIMAAVALLAVSAAASTAALPSAAKDTDAVHGAWYPLRKLAGSRPGANVKGLSSLKQYLHRFGYLRNPTVSDYFDDAMETAVKTYQANFRLNVTGVLDNSTLSFMVRPRCGVPDVVNGTSTMRAGGVRTVAHFSYFPGTPTWPPFKRNLTYAFLPPSVKLPADPPCLSAIFAAAFARWANVTSLTFRETDEFLLADIRIGFFSGDHGDGEPFDGGMGTLAHAFSPPDGRFHLDSDEKWNVDADDVKYGEIDLESVAVHEIGHLLGLGHSSSDEDIMFPTITAGTRRVHLGSDDVEGIQQLYGANPSFNADGTYSSPGPAMPEPDTGSAGRRHYNIDLYFLFLFTTIICFL